MLKKIGTSYATADSTDMTENKHWFSVGLYRNVLC